MLKNMCHISFLIAVCACAAFAGAAEQGISVSEDFAYSNEYIQKYVQKLNDLAQKDESGKLLVMGTEGTWVNKDGVPGNAKLTKEAVFDGDQATFFDPPDEANNAGGAWAGLSFEKPVIVTKIRYLGRGQDNYYQRMKGCIFQGANEPDFSDAYDLAVADFQVDRPKGYETVAWNGQNYYCEIAITNESPLSCGFKYVRIIGPNRLGGNPQNGMCCGNAAEVEFYGIDVGALREGAPSLDDPSLKPTIGAVVHHDGYLDFDVTFPFPTDANGMPDDRGLFGYEMERFNLVKGEWVLVAERGDFLVAEGTKTSVRMSFYETEITTAVQYRFRTFNLNGPSEEAILTMPEKSRMPLNVTVEPANLPNGGAKVSWEDAKRMTNVVGIAVYRSTARGGPWTCLTEEPLAADAHSYVDAFTDGKPHIYFYQLHYVFTDPIDETKTVEGEASEITPFRVARSLEREWSADGTTCQLREGVKVFCHEKPWAKAGEQPQNPVEHLFDGNTNTFADVVVVVDGTDKGYGVAGVDLGRPYVITSFKAHPRRRNASEGTGIDNQYMGRFRNLRLYGTNDENGWMDLSTCTVLSDYFKTNGSWYEEAFSDPQEFRYVFIQGADAFCNATELELFGYSAQAEYSETLLEPHNIKADFTDNGVQFSWNSSAHAEFYRVYTRASEDAAWQALATTSETHYLFTDLSLTARHSYFMIAAVRTITAEDGAQTEEEACTMPLRPYRPDTGTGLWGVYRCPYRNHRSQSKTWIQRTDAKIDFNWGTDRIIPACPNSTTDVYIVWSGMLSVPVEGLYTFHTDVDNGVALQIDGKEVINNWDKPDDDEYTGSVYLKEGMYPIRLDYQTFTTPGKETSFCRLYWSGAVPKEIIPTSQLYSQPLPELPYPWMGERTFNSRIKGYTVWNQDTESFDISCGGGDLWLKDATCQFVWRLACGDFSISAKFKRTTHVLPTLENDRGWAWKGQLMARKDMNHNAPFVAASYASDGEAGRFDLKLRRVRDTNIEDYVPTIPGLPAPLHNREDKESTTDDDESARIWGLPPEGYQKLERKGNVFTAYFKEKKQDEWIPLKTWTDEEGVMRGSMFIGISSSSTKECMQLGGYNVSDIEVTSEKYTSITYIR